jgi:hypothetical protein
VERDQRLTDGTAAGMLRYSIGQPVRKIRTSRVVVWGRSKSPV